jgi:hypothetical protein
MNSHLFESLPIGALFLHNPHNELENPSIKIDDKRARTPRGDVIEIGGRVQVYTRYAQPTQEPVNGEEVAYTTRLLGGVA